MRARERRAGERGLSLLEALIMLSVTALVALLLLPMAGGAIDRRGAQARASLTHSAAARAEAVFRALLRDARQPERNGPPPTSTIVGDAQSLLVSLEPGADHPCAPRERAAEARLSIVTRGAGGVLTCASEGRTYSILTWESGEGALSYSLDGALWRTHWGRDPNVYDSGALRGEVALVEAPLTRFVLRAPGQDLVWIERAGASAVYAAPPGLAAPRAYGPEP